MLHYLFPFVLQSIWSAKLRDVQQHVVNGCDKWEMMLDDAQLKLDCTKDNMHKELQQTNFKTDR